MEPATIIFIVTNILTAYIFYKLGKDQGGQINFHRFSHYILKEVYETVAEEFYPNDPDAENKVRERMARRSFSRLMDEVFRGKSARKNQN